ncbi:MAG TPA: class I SAM-dependent methyltransferase [Ktedonobacteraceae bacterium]|nr:class I SAM-dependent methyltransferase [Ktedonobacteraceae bacterium]
MHMHHGKSDKVPLKETQGHVIDWGWRYDLLLWWSNLQSRGKWHELQRRITDLAQFQPGETVLDVGCGTGTLALKAYARVGATGRVSGIDPGPKQIARARSKARRAGLPIDFQVGVIEQLAFPDQSFDVVLSTFMMHVLPDDLKRQGLAEIARVLKPGGRLLVVDFKRPEEHQDQSDRPVHTGPWNSGVQDQAAFLKEAGFSQLESGEIETGATKIPEVGFARARKS